MDFAGKNVLITGINGFVGTHAAQRFLDLGAHVIGLVKDYNRKTSTELLDRCSVVTGDIRDFKTLSYTISHYEVNLVLHLASQAIVKICHSDPRTAYETNVLGMVNLLEACRIQELPPEKVLVMVSDKYYGPSDHLPYVEDLPPTVGDTYCTSKTCQDMIAHSYSKTYGTPVVTMRGGNIYGPGDYNMSRLIPRTLVRLLNGERPVLYSQAQNMIREFIYVSDVVDAFVTLFDKGVVGEAYNIGGTAPMTIGKVMEAMRDSVDPDMEIEVKGVEFPEVDMQYLSGKKLKALGWDHKVSFEEGLARTKEFYESKVREGFQAQ